MELNSAVDLLCALGHGHRLAAFRRLIEAGEEGLPAGVLAQELGVAAGTLSFHLKELTHAGLIIARPDRQFIYYSANLELMNELVRHLTENCCGGRDCVVRRSPQKARKPGRLRRAA